MCNIRYSLIYAVTRPQIDERISVGIIIIEDDKIDIRYSENKLNALKFLFTKPELDFVTDIVRGMSKNESIKNVGDIDYLSRYSNNLINFSSVETLDLEATEENKKWLFDSYVGGLRC